MQDLRKQAELALDARITLFVDGPVEVMARLEPYFDTVAADTLPMRSDCAAAAGRQGRGRGGARCAAR